jgi:hypothetical protein
VTALTLAMGLKFLVFYAKNEHKNIILCSFCHTIVK